MPLPAWISAAMVGARRPPPGHDRAAAGPRPSTTTRTSFLPAFSGAPAGPRTCDPARAGRGGRTGGDEQERVADERDQRGRPPTSPATATITAIPPAGAAGAPRDRRCGVATQAGGGAEHRADREAGERHLVARRELEQPPPPAIAASTMLERPGEPRRDDGVRAARDEARRPRARLVVDVKRAGHDPASAPRDRRRAGRSATRPQATARPTPCPMAMARSMRGG